MTDNKTLKSRLAALKETVAAMLTFAEAPSATDTPAATDAPEGELNDGEYRLADGTIVKAASLETGAAVTMLTPEGEVPATAGEYQMEDGRILVINEHGTIGNVLEKVAEVAMSDLTPEVLTEMIEKAMGKVEAKFSAIIESKDAEMEAVKKANDVLIAKHRETLIAFNKLTELVDELGESTPAPVSEQKAADHGLGYFKKQN